MTVKELYEECKKQGSENLELFVMDSDGYEVDIHSYCWMVEEDRPDGLNHPERLTLNFVLG